MASAMIAGLLAAKTVRARDVIACDLSDERLRWLDEHGVRGTKDVRVVVEESDGEWCGFRWIRIVFFGRVWYHSVAYELFYTGVNFVL